MEAGRRIMSCPISPIQHDPRERDPGRLKAAQNVGRTEQR